MLQFPQIDPVIIQVGPLAVRWYGMMYLLGFLGGYFQIRHLARYRKLPINDSEISDLLFYCILGVILGGRLGYTLFYNLGHYLQHPLKVFAVWEGGMSFHGGLLGVVVAAVIYCLNKKLPLLLTGDILVASATIGLCLGRLGNFINAELWGRVTDVPWGMVFPGGGSLPRHPSQLYEAFWEGFVLWGILFLLHRIRAAEGVPFMAFFALYGLFRFTIEFFREPDPHLGFLWGGATMGQMLCIPMILFGGIGLVRLLRKDGGRA